MAFDKNQPHDTVFGSTEDNARYVQDGVRYNARGQEVGREVVPDDAPPRERLRPLAKAPTTVSRPGGRVRNSLTPQDRENRQALAAEGLAE